MYVNATYAILCDNYGSNLALRCLTLLVSLSCSAEILRPFSRAFSWVHRGLQRSLAILRPAGLPSLLPGLPFHAKPPIPHHLLQTLLGLQDLPDHTGLESRQTARITSPSCHFGPNWHRKSHCHSAVSQVCPLSRSQAPLSPLFPSGHQSSESELPQIQLT